MTKGRGGGKTPERVIQRLQDAVNSSSQLAVSRELGIGIAALNRYLKGIGEPTQATLEKLAAYFGVTVVWLRGEEEQRSTKLMRLIEDFELAKLVKDRENGTLSQEGQNKLEVFNKEVDLLRAETNFELQNKLKIAAPLIDVMQAQICATQWGDALEGLRYWLEIKAGKINSRQILI